MAGELKDRLNVSLQAVAQVLVVCGLGVYLARRHGLDRKAVAAVSGVNWHVLIPALMFSSIVGAVTPANLAMLWPMLLVSLLHIVLGAVPSFLLGWAARLPRDVWFFTVSASSLPNCGNLPWLFMPSIIKYYAPPAEAAAQMQYMVGLVSVYTIITILVTLTVPFIIKRPPDSLLLPRRRQQQQQQQQQRQGELAVQQQGQLQDVGSTQRGLQLQAADSFASHRSSSRLLQAGQSLLGSFSASFSRGLRRSESIVALAWTYPLGWQRERTAAAPAAAAATQQRQECQQQQQGRAEQGAPRYQRYVPRRLAVLLRCCAAVLDHPAVNVPLGATVLGVACAAVGPVRGLLVDELAPLHWLWLALGWVGAAAAPLATMQIGAELMQAAPVELGMHVPRRVQWTATAIAIGVKLLLVPLLNVALIRTAGMHTLVPAEDKVYQLLLLVEAAVPAAVTLLVVCGRVYPDIRPLSQMLFWQYVASLVTLPAFLVWFMYMLDL
ncbi:auxin efflux carrier [Scenedesmus sp. NREL 46B-D3]|nr:auxin efflux carrier [Scenedesmus sp. NREL 46B-D3]